MQNIIYKVTIEKGWNPCDQKVYKTFYFGNSENACDFIERIGNAQHSYKPKHFRYFLIMALISSRHPDIDPRPYFGIHTYH